MAVSGKRYESSRLIGSFRAKRLSTGGMVRGTYATLGRTARWEG
jgi:hypothetical protein